MLGDLKQFLINIWNHKAVLLGTCGTRELYLLRAISVTVLSTAPSVMLVVKWYSDTFPQEQLATSVYIPLFEKTNKNRKFGFKRDEWR